MTVQAELIHQPTSGTYREIIFDVSWQDFTIRSWSWVLFTKSDGTEWVGSFHGGQSDKRFVATLKDEPVVFVVSDGQGYFINAEKEELIKFTEEDTITEVVSIDSMPLIIYANIWNIFTVYKSLEVKTLVVPFQFYFVRFKDITGDLLEIEYEEEYTGEFVKTYLNTNTLQFVTAEK